MSRELPIHVRAMSAGDVDTVVDIAGRLPQAPHWPRSVYEAALDPGRKPDRVALVAQAGGVEGVVSGFCMALLVPPQAELETLAVSREYHRKGVATRLMEVLLVKLKQMSITEVMLEVRASNQGARDLYASLGFVGGGLRKRYYADPEEDALVLRLGLREWPR